MICHIVLVRLRSDLPDERVEAFLDAAREILGGIDGVRNLRVGRRLREDSPHPYCLVMDFEDEAALEAYQVHPEHQRFLREVIGPIVEDKTVYDYVCP